MKRPLLEITTSSHGLDYVIHSAAMVDYLLAADVCGGGYPGGLHNLVGEGGHVVSCPICDGRGYTNRAEVVQALADRRRSLVEELRQLARALELGSAPFSNYGVPDPVEGRGQAEAEIDRLVEHIVELQKRGVR